MRKKTFTKKTINRCYNPPPSNTAVATYNNHLQLEKIQKVLSHHRKKKIVKLTQCTTLYSCLERITISKSKKKSWKTLVQTKNQRKSRSHL